MFKKNYKNYFLILIISSLPLIIIFLNPQPPHTSDGAMHAIRFAAFYKEVSEGQFPVRWTSQFHYGYGTMLFNFVYPLPYLVALPFIAMQISPTTTLNISFLLTFILAGIGMYLFASSFFKDRRTAFLVTLLYQFAPFRLVEMLVRGNIGSLYAYAIVPFLFFSILNFLKKKTYISWLLIAISVSLLTLSHTILGFAFLAVSGAFVLIFSKKLKEIIATYGAFIAGITLSSYFIIPAVLEEKYTNGYLFTKDVFYHHFPSLWALLLPNFTDSSSLRIAEISVQIGLFHVLSLFVGIFFFIRNRFEKQYKLIVIFFIVVTVATIVFMQPIAKPLWENVSFIRQFQFPWRFLGVIAFTTSILGGFIFSKIIFLRKNLYFITLCILIVFSTVYYWRPTQGYDNYDQSFYWNYPLTTNYFSEVNTIWMGREPTEFPTKKVDVIGGEAQIISTDRKSTKHYYEIIANQPSNILDHTFFFPGWKVYVNENEVPIQFQDPAFPGMITFQIPEGKNIVRVQFEQSKIQQLGNILSISFILLLGIISILFFFVKRSESLKYPYPFIGKGFFKRS